MKEVIWGRPKQWMSIIPIVENLQWTSSQDVNATLSTLLIQDPHRSLSKLKIQGTCAVDLAIQKALLNFIAVTHFRLVA